MAHAHFTASVLNHVSSHLQSKSYSEQFKPAFLPTIEIFWHSSWAKGAPGSGGQGGKGSVLHSAECLLPRIAILPFIFSAYLRSIWLGDFGAALLEAEKPHTSVCV